MTGRERVLESLAHREPEGVAVDFGGHRSSGISAMAYARLKDELGITSGDIYVYDVVQQLAIVEEEVLKFERWMQTLNVVPTIISLKEKAAAIRRAELKRSLSALGTLTDAQRRSIENLTTSITEKIINDPILVLKRKADRSTRDIYLDITRKLFNLDQDDDE